MMLFSQPNNGIDNCGHKFEISAIIIGNQETAVNVAVVVTPFSPLTSSG